MFLERMEAMAKRYPPEFKPMWFRRPAGAI